MAEISRSDLKSLSAPAVASITNVKPLSSYNWIDRPTATIAVPGSPPVWSAPTGSRHLSKDSGQVYIDQNRARHPDHPLEPLFRALYTTDPSFDISSVDLVTDRNNIRKLLSFITPGLTTNEPEPFSIGVMTIGKTTILCREEPAATQLIGPLEFRGFGHEFEKSYTTSQIQDSTGHHRIISYQFGGLNFVVRYEADGYVAEDLSLASPDSKKTDDLVTSMGSLSLSPTPGHTMDVPVNSKLTVEHKGQVVPRESILEIKTRSSNRPLAIREIGPQLWVSQTSKLVRAYHNRGTFSQPYIEDVKAHIKNWEEFNQSKLRELSALINEIIRVVREYGGSATIKYDGRERLTVHKADRKETLPNDLYSKWSNSGGHGAAAVVDHQAASTSVARLDEQREARAASGLSEVTGAKPRNYGGAPYSSIIDYAMDKGFRQFFRRMPTQLSQYHVLCDNLDALGIDVTEGRTVRGIMEDMRKGKSDWDPDERRTISGLKNVARDAAFRLLYMIMQFKIDDSNMAYNATLFVVSHRGIFKSRTRNMVLQAFKERFNISPKQRTALEKWPVGYFGGELSEDDVTTANEDDFYFDSDNSF